MQTFRLFLAVFLLLSVVFPASGEEEPDFIKKVQLRAEQGDPQAQGHLAHLYVLLNKPEERLQLLIKAAEQGNVDAQADLAGAYQSGKIVKQDLSEAYFWYSVALDARDTINNIFITDPWVIKQSEIKKQLTEEQFVQAAKRASSWKPKQNAQHLAQSKEFCERTLKEYVQKTGDTCQSAAHKDCIEQCITQLRNQYPRNEAINNCPSEYWREIAPPAVTPH